MLASTCTVQSFTHVQSHEDDRARSDVVVLDLQAEQKKGKRKSRIHTRAMINVERERERASESGWREREGMVDRKRKGEQKVEFEGGGMGDGVETVRMKY